MRELKGWHVLAMLVGFFAVTIGVNAYFIYAAISSAPGEDQRKSYLQGLRYNDVLAARAAQAKTGWQAAYSARRGDAGEALLVVKVSDRDGAAVNGLALKGRLRHPTKVAEDVPVTLSGDAAGHYRAAVKDVARGSWTLVLDAEDRNGQAPFHMEAQLWLP